MLSTTCMVRENMVWDLTGQRLSRVGRSVNRTALYEKKSGGLPAFVLNLVGGLVLRHLTKRLTDDAIWFRGAAQEIGTLREDADLDHELDVIRSSLDRIKTNLRDIRADLLRYQVDTNPANKLYIGRSDLLAALTDLFEAVENFRWALLDAQADGAKRIEGFGATNADELDAVFKKLEQQA